MKKDNDFLIAVDSEAMQMCMSEEYGGLNKNLSEITFLEFRKFIYKKYYVEDEE